MANTQCYTFRGVLPEILLWQSDQALRRLKAQVQNAPRADRLQTQTRSINGHGAKNGRTWRHMNKHFYSHTHDEVIQFPATMKLRIRTSTTMTPPHHHDEHLEY
jgi:hypothetical protein